MQQQKDNLYILHGDARLLLEEALAELIKELLPSSNADFNYDVFDAETVDITQVIAAANTLPVFSEHRLVVVRRAERYLESKKAAHEETEDEVNDENGIIKGEEKSDTIEVILNYASDPNPSTVLILAASRKLDSRKKTFKELTKLGKVLNYAEPQYRETTAWLMSRLKDKYNKRITNDAAQFLVTAVGRSSGMLVGELEKLALFCQDKKEINIHDVKALAIQGTEVFVFDFIDALVEKRPQQALDLLDELLRKGEVPPKILVILAGQLRSLISTKALRERGLNKQDIAKHLGNKSDFVIQKYLRQERHFTKEGLVQAMRFLADADAKTKFGMGEAKNLLFNAVIKIAGLIK